MRGADLGFMISDWMDMQPCLSVQPALRNQKSEIRNQKSSPIPCRLLVDPPASGAWNMAVDEALLEEAADQRLATLRFYQWSEPTLSLGYFQRLAERDQHAASRHANVVRRISGGGALVHDRELTYSLCLGPNHSRSRRPAQLYQTVHTALIDSLSHSNVGARLHGPTVTHPREADPFLCFARRSEFDVVLDRPPTSRSSPPKIAGSAQRRRRGAVLQHGAVLLDASPSAPELPGLKQFHSAAIPLGDLIDSWSAALAERLNLRLEPFPAAGNAPLQLRQELHEKHKSSAWVTRC
jgi:lipoyl(octanoyl) transferase